MAHQNPAFVLMIYTSQESGVPNVLQSCTTPAPRPVAALAFGLDTLSVAGLMSSADERIERVALQQRSLYQQKYAQNTKQKNT